MVSNEIEFIEKLKDIETFPLWKFQITIIFKANDLFSIVEGSEKCDISDSKKKADWEKRDAKAQKLIISSLGKGSMLHIINCKTSEEMFKKLSSIYERDSDQQKYTLLQDFFNIRYETNHDITTHISKIENLAHRLNMLDEKVDEKMIMSKILVTLPERFKYFVSAWESVPSNEKSLTNLTARLIAEEARNEFQDIGLNKNVAFQTNCFICKNPGHIARFCKSKNVSKNSENHDYNPKRCFKCNKKGHFANSCKKVEVMRGTNNMSQFCTICKKTNHSDKDCYFRKSNLGSKDTNKSFISFLSVDQTNYNRSKDFSEWVIDSGSSAHMVNNDLLLDNTKDMVSEISVAKKCESMNAFKVGVVKSEQCELTNVLYVPDLSKNLMSVAAITEKGGEVIFSKNKVIVSKDGHTVFEGCKNENRLYTVKLIDVRNQQKAHVAEKYSTNTNMENNELWHRRLGHLSYGYMKKLIPISEGLTLNSSKFEMSDGICDICIKSKQTRLPFNSERTRANRPLEIIHTDVCGPFEQSTWDGNKYFVSLIDDFTNFVMVYPIKGKFEVPSIIKEYIAEVEGKWNLKIHKLRCDNGGEYVSAIFKNWCKAKGIILDYSVPYSPQLNGKAERLNRTILEKTRALLFDSKLKSEMWGEAVRTSAYLLNRSPSDAIDTTAFEKWMGKKPNLSRLQVFGSKVFVRVTKPLKKLESRSEEYVFVGYAMNAYRLWDETKRKIKISRDVKFVDELKSGVDKNCDKLRNKIVADECVDIDWEETLEESFEEPSNGENEINIQGSDTSCEENEVNIEQTIDQVVENQNKRSRKMPEKFKDYVLLTYQEAITGDEKDKWIEAIKQEKQSLIENKTWIPVDESETNGKTILSNKWIFTVKEDGRYKARLVVKGFQQKEGIDYEETFSPVVSNAALRLIFAIASKNDFEIMKFDIKTAFLYGDLKEDIFMSVPDGFEYGNKVLKLQKTLYGLKQAPFKWNELFTKCLEQYGLTQTKSDRCIFSNGKMHLAIFVDDGILVGNNKNEMKQLLQNLSKDFKVKISENPTSFLGMEIQRNENGLKLKQEKYTYEILEKYGMLESKSVDTPIVCTATTEAQAPSKNKGEFPYREAIGNLLYLSNKTRPDITLAVGIESRSVEKPNCQDIINVKRTLRYLKGTPDVGIQMYSSKFSEEEEILNAHCDSDYANCNETRRSTTGYIIMYGRSPVSWCTRRQPIVALSSTEAEYIAGADCIKELLYLKTLVQELTKKHVDVKLNMDNQSAIKLSKNGVFNKRSKHIDVRYHFMTENVRERKVTISYVPTSENLADIFTKPLSSVKYQKIKKSSQFKKKILFV